MFDCSPVFYANYNSKAKIVVNQGGTSSSKTYSLMQLLFYKAITEPKDLGGNRTIITVVGESIPNLKKGAYRDAETIYAGSKELQQYISFWNKTERIIYFKNGAEMEFTSYENEQGAKNGKRSYLFVNEANGIDWHIFFQLAIRTRNQIFIDYNPTAPFWAHDKLIGTSPETNELSAQVQLIISDHRHNPFLLPDEHYKIENIKDPELHRVYARGLTGNIEGIIYPNWKMISPEDFPEVDGVLGGIDYGYTNDPTALVKICRVGDNIYVKELCYQTGLGAQQLRQILSSFGFNARTPIYSEHDTQMIPQLRAFGFLVLPANKRPGSLSAGIQKLKEFNVFYTSDSYNLREELKRYVWIKNPATGRPTNTPIDQYNHLLDAVRYAVYTHYFREP